MKMNRYMGYYPAATGVTAGAINMTITGQEDVIYASAVEGSRSTEITAPLAFGHKLTQFKFIIKRDADIVDVANVGVKVKDANLLSVCTDKWIKVHIFVIPKLQ